MPKGKARKNCKCPKQFYVNRLAATRACVKMKQRHKLEFYIYKCPNSFGYHVTKKQNKFSGLID